jgi:hypothetical protein
MKRTVALLALVFALLAPGQAVAGEYVLRGFQPAAEGLQREITARYPASETFVNCPGGNRWGEGLGCEFRLRADGEYRQGVAQVRPLDPAERFGSWEVTVFQDSYFKNRFKRCPDGGLPRLGGRLRPFELYTSGLACEHARRFARLVGDRLGLYRSPRTHFRYTVPMPHSRGFVLNEYRCTGDRSSTFGRYGKPPYERLTAYCKNPREEILPPSLC